MCPYCSASYHWECPKPVMSDDLIMCCCDNSNGSAPKIIGQRTPKANEDIRDQESTGRKRAAQVKPLTPDMICEWAGLKKAGGGVKPIVGCKDNRATNRHHGPDKSTLNNELYNLHAICATCHNRWHTLNDEYYGERPGQGRPFIPLDKEMLPHDSETKASIEELYNNEVWWMERAAQKREEKKNVGV